MNKIIIFIIIALIIAGLTISFLFNSQKLKGIPIDANSYSGATNTKIVCSGATSTQIVATSTRELFELTVASSTSITLCKSGMCIVENGIKLNGDGGTYEQDDGYYGAYSCIGNANTSSTVGVIYKQ